MLPKEFVKTRMLYEAYMDSIESIPSHRLDALEDELENPKTGRFWNYDLEKCYEEDFECYSKEQFFFYGCSYSVYEKFYNERKENFKKDIVDAEEIDFIIKDYNNLSFNYHFKFSSEKTKEQIDVSLSSQREFLEKRINELGYILILKTDIYGNKRYNYKVNLKHIKEDNHPLVDLSDTKATEKILYLHYLGAIDFFKEKSSYGYSINQIATILSAITGEKAKTIQSYINPIGNPTVSQKNNPLNNSVKSEKVKQKLIDLGFYTL